MADASSGSTLLPVIVGGVLTMGGGVIAAAVSLIDKFYERSAEKKKRRAEKFEELVSAVYEFDRWLEKKRGFVFRGEGEEVGPPPFAKIEAIAAVYFPGFMKKIEDLGAAWRVLEVWISTTTYMRIKGTLEDTNNFGDVIKPYVGARDALLNDLKTHASGEFQ